MAGPECALLYYAIVDGEKRPPFHTGRGVCPCCGGGLIAKCGEINAHHWAHEAREECDSWSEPLGPWHLWWQNLVRPEFVEVISGLHRADIVGNGGMVVELQHSPISAEDVRAREAHYGNMVWLFDATQRFASVTSGERVFFSVGQTKHLELCRKPVFLDFGFHVVQVERFTDAVHMLSGFGLLRSRSWFADTFLTDVRRPGTHPGGLFVPQGNSSYPWARKNPVWKLKHPTVWVDPATGRSKTYPKWTEYVMLNYYTRRRVGDSQVDSWNYDKMIDLHPELANGWTKATLAQMKEFLGSNVIILGGLLRLLPRRAEAIRAGATVSATQHLLGLAEGHIQAGRLPVLKASTKEGILERARQNEVGRCGRTLRPPGDGQRSLFE